MSAHALDGVHVVRVDVRDAEATRLLFVLDAAEAWKLALGVQRLRHGTQAQARNVAVAALGAAEAREALRSVGWCG